MPASSQVSHGVVLLQITALLSQAGSLFESVLGDAVLYLDSSTYTSNSSCPTDGTAGSILGPSIGQLVPTVNLDSNFYSWVGCNCSLGTYARVYDIAADGELTVHLVPQASYVVGSMAQCALADCHPSLHTQHARSRRSLVDPEDQVGPLDSSLACCICTNIVLSVQTSSPASEPSLTRRERYDGQLVLFSDHACVFWTCLHIRSAAL